MKTSIFMRISEDVKTEIEQVALEERRSMTKQIEYILLEYVKKKKKEVQKK